MPLTIDPFRTALRSQDVSEKRLDAFRGSFPGEEASQHTATNPVNLLIRNIHDRC
jgi:hypothetical protein